MALPTPPNDTSGVHHHIVALEERFCALPKFDLPSPQTYTLTSYHSSTQDDIPSRIRDATIVITTTIPLSAAVLAESVSPQLRLIVVMATGTDSIDLAACRRRGITVCNCAGASTVAVSEHAIGSYFALRRRFVDTHEATKEGEWAQKGTLIPMLKDEDGRMPLTCGEETLGLIGYGSIGQRIGRLARALGMKVVVAERKGAQAVRADRIAFEEVLRTATVLVLIIPRSPETVGLIGAADLAMMSRSAVLINVSRGGIVDEAAVLDALRARRIGGVAFDVYAQEPASTSTSPLLASDTKGLNLLTTPHTAWLANSTTTTLQQMAKDGLEGWCRDSPANVVV